MAEYNSIKVSGLFRTKRQGMYVGNISPDVMEELQALMNTGKAQKNGVVLFMFKNQREGGPLFNLLADAAKPRNDGKKKYRKPIDEDDDAGEDAEPGREDDDDNPDDFDEPTPKPKKKVKKPVRTDDDDF